MIWAFVVRTAGTTALGGVSVAARRGATYRLSIDGGRTMEGGNADPRRPVGRAARWTRFGRRTRGGSTQDADPGRRQGGLGRDLEGGMAPTWSGGALRGPRGSAVDPHGRAAADRAPGDRDRAKGVSRRTRRPVQ